MAARVGSSHQTADVGLRWFSSFPEEGFDLVSTC
jgi:hypothetical protein